MKNKRNTIDRRTFLKTAGIGGASFALSAGLAVDALSADDAGDSSSKMPTRVLGKTGVPVSILGMGGGVDPSAYMTLLRVGLNLGINYWDSSTIYGNGKNEEVIGQFFSQYPEDRKKVFQVTKAAMVTEPEGLTSQLNQSLKRMQTDYIDLYFMHGIQDTSALTPAVKAWAEQKKKEGKIRFFGFSCHGNMAQMLSHAATLGWIDAAMATYNYQVMNNDDMKKAVDACSKAGVGLIAMKTQGQLFSMPSNPPGGREGGLPSGFGEQASGREGSPEGPPPGSGEEIQGREGMPQGLPSGFGEQAPGLGGSPEGPLQGIESQDAGADDISAMTHFMDKGYTLEQAKLKVVWEDKRISVCLSEMSSLTILKANVAAAVDGVKLSSSDRKVLDRYAKYNRPLYCQGCMRCENIMGSESRIPNILRYMMYYNSYGKTDDARRLFKELPEPVKNNLASRDFSPAERLCPNKIQIGKAMRRASKILA